MDIFLRYAALTDYTPNKTPTRAYDARLFYVVSGEGEMLFEQRRVHFSSGSLFLYPAGTIYLPMASEENKPKFVTLNFDFDREESFRDKVMPPVSIADFRSDLAINSHLKCEFEQFKEIIILYGVEEFEADLKKIVELFCEGTHIAKETAEALLSYLCLKIAGSVSKENSLCEKVCNFIRSNFKKPLTVAGIAEEFSYHPNYLGAVFKKLTGNGVLSYLNDVRLNSSKEMLLKGKSVAETAFSVGFKNADHFSKKFSEKFGMTPTEFKKENIWI